jgi:hypothetical protein
MTPIRVPLSAQIAEAARWRDKAEELAKTNPAIEPRAQASGAIVETLKVFQAMFEKGQTE